MSINIHYGKRQSGKTSKLMDLVTILLSINRNILLIVPNKAFLDNLENSFPDIILNPNLRDSLLVMTSNEIKGTHFRGISGSFFDTIVIDELSLIEDINPVIQFLNLNHRNIEIYATDTIGV